jgi:hypothetical protein
MEECLITAVGYLQLIVQAIGVVALISGVAPLTAVDWFINRASGVPVPGTGRYGVRAFSGAS